MSELYLGDQLITPVVMETVIGEGVSDYEDLENIPTINNVELIGNKTASDLGLATPIDIMQAIASIPQFSISIVDELPLAGEKMMLYLVSKGGESPDVYDEYIWIEQTSSFEFLGTTAVDLTDYVKKTDYAGYNVGGVIRQANYTGVRVDGAGILQGVVRTLEQYYDGTSLAGTGLICKTTLENVLTQYSKTVSITQADYDSLETKDSNTLYLIEE